MKSIIGLGAIQVQRSKQYLEGRLRYTYWLLELPLGGQQPRALVPCWPWRVPYDAPGTMPLDPDHEAARVAFYQSIMAAFCKVLHDSRLPPMTVMGFAATAIGSIYQDVASHHRRAPLCGCGWQPDPASDIEALQTALVRAARSTPLPDLRFLQAAGRA